MGEGASWGELLRVDLADEVRLRRARASVPAARLPRRARGATQLRDPRPVFEWDPTAAATDAGAWAGAGAKARAEGPARGARERGAHHDVPDERRIRGSLGASCAAAEEDEACRGPGSRDTCRGYLPRPACRPGHRRDRPRQHREMPTELCIDPVVEITADQRFSGGALAETSRASLRSLLAAHGLSNA